MLNGKRLKNGNLTIEVFRLLLYCILGKSLITILFLSEKTFVDKVYSSQTINSFLFSIFVIIIINHNTENYYF